MRITSAGKHIMRVTRGRNNNWVTYYVRHHRTGKWKYFGTDRPSGMYYLKARAFSDKQIADILAFLPRYEKENAFIGRTNFNHFMRAIPRYHRERGWRTA